MTSHRQSPDPLVFTGLDGSNPLAFLAALGTLRTLTLAMPGQPIRMGWLTRLGAWRPALYAADPLDQQAVLHALEERLLRMRNHPSLNFADDLNMTLAEFREHAVSSAASSSPADRTAADFAAAFACDTLSDPQDKTGQKVQDTALRTMSGAGHQHFLKSMRAIVDAATVEHLRKALFAPWTYDDPVEKQTLRWDPADDSRYALQWRNPSGDPSRRVHGSMLGANRLAIEGLPMIPCAPDGGLLRTTGFVGRGSRDTFWYWPIWRWPASMDLCRSLLSHASLLCAEADAVAKLKALGVATAFRSQRITVGKFRNFAPATAVF